MSDCELVVRSEASSVFWTGSGTPSGRMHQRVTGSLTKPFLDPSSTKLISRRTLCRVCTACGENPPPYGPWDGDGSVIPR